MRELSLFTGAGGGLLGTKQLGWAHVGYVEWNEYCQRVIARRIADGFLDEAPIFTDVREFVQSGAAEQYRGIADVVSGGFPCQPFSVAGKQLADADERNMWPATVEVIRHVQPRSVLLENVPGLVSCGYIGTVLADLAALGYVGRWGVLGASDVGAPHARKRLWIVAHALRDGCQAGDRRGLVSDGDRLGAGEECGREFKQQGIARPSDVADASGRRRGDASEREVQQSRRAEVVGAGSPVAHTDRLGSSGPWWAIDPGSPEVEGDREVNRAFDGSRWGIESRLGRVANGVAHRVDRLKAIGNGQVSGVVARAWGMLT